MGEVRLVMKRDINIALSQDLAVKMASSLFTSTTAKLSACPLQANIP